MKRSLNCCHLAATLDQLLKQIRILLTDEKFSNLMTLILARKAKTTLKTALALRDKDALF